eukprot:g1286.t1
MLNGQKKKVVDSAPETEDKNQLKLIFLVHEKEPQESVHMFNNKVDLSVCTVLRDVDREWFTYLGKPRIKSMWWVINPVVWFRWLSFAGCCTRKMAVGLCGFRKSWNLKAPSNRLGGLVVLSADGEEIFRQVERHVGDYEGGKTYKQICQMLERSVTGGDVTGGDVVKSSAGAKAVVEASSAGAAKL